MDVCSNSGCVFQLLIIVIGISRLRSVLEVEQVRKETSLKPNQEQGKNIIITFIGMYLLICPVVWFPTIVPVI